MTLATYSGCAGCAACYAICPRRAISMKTDNEGFLYPIIDQSLCVDCGLCEKVCPSLHPMQPREPLAVYATKAKDDAIRMASSSGGMFSLLAKQTLDNRGVVFGAAFDHDDWHVYHRAIEHKEELDELRGSKYVQSEIGDSYQQAEVYLRSGRTVLFSGTPCQIAGLNHYLSMRSNAKVGRLLTVDVVCHAVPSPLAWRKYLECRIGSVCNTAGEEARVNRVIFRCKENGWKQYSVVLGFDCANEYRRVFNKDLFMRGFLAELYNRPSCHNCFARGMRCGSDLTIADYWCVNQRFPEMDDDKGVSLVCVNTQKGMAAFASIDGSLNKMASDFSHAKKINPAIITSPQCHKKRGVFFERIEHENFDTLVNKDLRPSLFKLAQSSIGRILHHIGLK